VAHPPSRLPKVYISNGGLKGLRLQIVGEISAFSAFCYFDNVPACAPRNVHVAGGFVICIYIFGSIYIRCGNSREKERDAELPFASRRKCQHTCSRHTESHPDVHTQAPFCFPILRTIISIFHRLVGPNAGGVMSE